MNTALDVNWNRAAPQPVQAVVVMDHEAEADMTTVAYRGSDGLLYGCRDITRGETHDAILAAWTSTDGIEVEDLRATPAPASRRAQPSPSARAVISYRRACAVRTPEAFETAAHDLAAAVGLHSPPPAQDAPPAAIIWRPRLIALHGQRLE